MKVVCGILSVLGLYWAWTAFAIYFLLAIVIFEGRDREFSEIAYVVVGSLLATVGYWIWTGWILRVLKGRYHRASPRTFWTVSLFQHTGWFLWLYMSDGPELSWDWAPLYGSAPAAAPGPWPHSDWTREEGRKPVIGP